MTPQQLKALDFIRDSITRTGVAPRLEDLGAHMGWSGKTRAYFMVGELEELGYIRRRPHRARGIELCDAPRLVGVSTEVLRAEFARRGMTLEALNTGNPQPLARGVARCAADCCGEPVDFGQLFCRPHWYQVPQYLREAILHAHRVARNSRRRDDIAEYQRVVGEARDLIDGPSYARRTG